MNGLQLSCELARCSQTIIQECNQALCAIDADQTAQLLDAISGAQQVFFIGVGRVLLSLEAIAKRLAHLGVNTHIVGEIAEPAITPEDLLIVGSGSGESLIPVAIAQKAVKLGAKVAYIGSNVNSTIANLAEVKVRIPVRTKLERPDEIESVQPMTSLFEQSLLLYGDTLAMMMAQERHIVLKDLWRRHANLE